MKAELKQLIKELKQNPMDYDIQKEISEKFNVRVQQFDIDYDVKSCLLDDDTDLYWSEVEGYVYGGKYGSRMLLIGYDELNEEELKGTTEYMMAHNVERWKHVVRYFDAINGVNQYVKDKY